MAVLQILALCIVILYLAYCFKEEIVDVLPAVVSLLILFLYGLAFVRHLSFLDAVNCVLVSGTGIYFLSRKKEQKIEIVSFCKRKLLHPGCIAAVITIVLVAVCVSKKLVTWWDDYNFWAADVKALFYLDGFAGKYCNVAAEFGDYPPGTQMMKWWFLHFSPDVFREGLMFAGYYAMNLVYLLPLMRKLPGKNVGILLLMSVMLWIFPNVAEEFYLSGSCADLTMGVIYGAFLAGVLDEEGHSGLFYYGRLALYLMVLVLLKNVGFLWAGFGIIFLCGYRLLVWNKERRTVCGGRKREIAAAVTVSLLPVITECSWLFFCFRMRRVAKLTGTAVSMAANGVHLPDYSGELIHTFLEAFCLWPLHRWKTWAIDLSPLALYLLICALVFILYKLGRWKKAAAWFAGIFFMVSGVLFYGINLVSHLTIFAIEEQYMEPFGMVSSIERYGAPFMVGGLYVIGFMYLNKRAEKNEEGDRGEYKKYLPYIICFGFVFLFADHKMAYEGLIGYRGGVGEVMSGRKDIIGSAGEKFLSTLEETKEADKIAEDYGMRVLYLRDGRNASWVQNTYISFEASPVSVMYGNFLPEQYEEADAVRAIAESHAGYLYVDEAGAGAEEVFGNMVPDGGFCYNTLYRIDTAGGKVGLTAVGSDR